MGRTWVAGVQGRWWTGRGAPSAIYGTVAGRRAGLTGWRLGWAAALTGLLGVALIALKSLLD